jgi:hypothetical protein
MSFLKKDQSIILDNSIKAAYIRFEKDTRYYELRLDKNLFDCWSITRINGRINTRLGSCKHEHFDCLSEAVARLNTMYSYRINNRKYKLIIFQKI